MRQNRRKMKYSYWLLVNLQGVVVGRFRYERDAIRAQGHLGEGQVAVYKDVVWPQWQNK